MVGINGGEWGIKGYNGGFWVGRWWWDRWWKMKWMGEWGRWKRGGREGE